LLIAGSASSVSCLLLAGYNFGEYTAETTTCTVTAYRAEGAGINMVQADGVAFNQIDETQSVPCQATLSVSYAASNLGSTALFEFPELPLTGNGTVVLVLAAQGSTFVCTVNPSDTTIGKVTLVESDGHTVVLATSDIVWPPGATGCWLGLPQATYSHMDAVSTTGKPISIDLVP
jgi:hypothetical protein